MKIETDEIMTRSEMISAIRYLQGRCGLMYLAADDVADEFWWGDLEDRLEDLAFRAESDLLGGFVGHGEEP